ncbi:hypothetical protein E2C01_088624 [Portunus trituberculatus]|uniref:Uncharacterized protein n=1 Tax=Portunus trituberculatus TaxID=210409 RepID=A0A5B7JMD8_PORTR|nr:hypothetical protein [Portunus trituberculatus]
MFLLTPHTAYFSSSSSSPSSSSPHLWHSSTFYSRLLDVFKPHLSLYTTSSTLPPSNNKKYLPITLGCKRGVSESHAHS